LRGGSAKKKKRGAKNRKWAREACERKEKGGWGPRSQVRCRELKKRNPKRGKRERGKLLAKKKGARGKKERGSRKRRSSRIKGVLRREGLHFLLKKGKKEKGLKRPEKKKKQ